MTPFQEDPASAATDHEVVLAAGALPWRRTASGGLEVALVHRPKYDDWAWSKGKLDPDESVPGCAVREVLEETGLVVRLGIPLTTAEYAVTWLDGLRRKVVWYWAAEVVGGSGELTNEVDEVAWLDPERAAERLDYRRDEQQLQALVQADRDGRLGTWPLVVVRHAKALGRGAWTGADPDRPLDERGVAQSAALVPMIEAWLPTRVLTSPSARCSATVAPYAAAHALALRQRPALSEEGYDEDPARAVTHLERLLARGEPAALCTHRPVLPALLERLAKGADEGASAALAAAVLDGLGKGEVLVAHVQGTGALARVVAVERHQPDV